MEFIRQVNLSLHYNLKYNILSNYIESSSSNLELNSESGLYEPIYIQEPNAGGRGRGIFPFDTTESGIFASCVEGTYIKVYHSIGEIPNTDYNINYTVPGITLVSGTDIPVSAEYKWNYVSVIDDWPSSNVPKLPIVLLLWKEFDIKGFQLGGGRKHICDVNIHVFGSSKPELDDLTYLIHSGLYNKCLTLFGFSGGDVFTWAGEFNSSFNCVCDEDICKLDLIDVNTKYLDLPVNYKNDLNAYRSKIALKLFAYKEA